MKDQICIITGSTSGIGKATAFSLARLGAKVVMIARNPSLVIKRKKKLFEYRQFKY